MKPFGELLTRHYGGPNRENGPLLCLQIGFTYSISDLLVPFVRVRCRQAGFLVHKGPWLQPRSLGSAVERALR